MIGFSGMQNLGKEISENSTYDEPISAMDILIEP
jgi:hypothetical protein